MRLVSCSILLAACGSSTPATPPAPASSPSPPLAVSIDAAPAGAIDAMPVAASDAAFVGPLISAAGDVDGVPGDEALVLASDGTLTAGTAMIQLELEHADPAGYATVSLRAISLGGQRRGVLLAMEEADGEDPPTRYRVARYDHGALRLVYDQGISGSLVFSPKGTGRYVESGWAACLREDPKNRIAKLHTVTLQLDAAGTKLVERRTPNGQVQNCDELSACPFVYELGAGAPWFAGEILRDLRSPSLEGLQSLALHASGAGPAVIRIAEEKPEVTFLDEVYLEVDGVRVTPQACTTAPAPAFCVADGRYHVLAQGDTLDLAVVVPAGARTLQARGYYLPQ